MPYNRKKKNPKNQFHIYAVSFPSRSQKIFHLGKCPLLLRQEDNTQHTKLTQPEWLSRKFQSNLGIAEQKWKINCFYILPCPALSINHKTRRSTGPCPSRYTWEQRWSKGRRLQSRPVPSTHQWATKSCPPHPFPGSIPSSDDVFTLVSHLG